MKMRSWTWVPVVLAFQILHEMAPWLQDRIGVGPTMGFCGICGILLGWFWYQRDPRPLADRLFAFAVFVVVVIAVSFLPGWVVSEGDDSVWQMIFVGVLAGLVLNEQRSSATSSWNRQRESATPRNDLAKEMR